MFFFLKNAIKHEIMKQDNKGEKHMPLVKLVTSYWKLENSFLAQL